MSRRYARNPGADQIAEWKAAVAAHRKQQRQQRGRRKPIVTQRVSGPGMVRRLPPSTKGGDGGHGGDGRPHPPR